MLAYNFETFFMDILSLTIVRYMFHNFIGILFWNINVNIEIFSQIQKQLSVLAENNPGNEDPGVNSEDEDDYEAEVCSSVVTLGSQMTLMCLIR